MRPWIVALFPVFLSIAAGWAVSDRVEQRNDFCNACHLPDGTALHLQNREHFDRVIPVSLAGVHRRGTVEDRDDDAFRCIDCHSGAGLVERGLVKVLAARDGIRFALGDFEEPDGMPFDLSPATCRRCHASFRHSAAPGWTVEAFHGRPEHAEPAALACVRCHAVHETDGDAFAYFMNRERVDRSCQKCHEPDGAGEVPSLRLGSR
jgi:hypothetical protein